MKLLMLLITIWFILSNVHGKRFRHHHQKKKEKQLFPSTDLQEQQTPKEKIEDARFSLTFNGKPINCPCACALQNEPPTEEEYYEPLVTGNHGEGRHASLIVVGAIVPILVISFLVALNCHRILACIKCENSLFKEYSKKTNNKQDFIIRTNRRKDSRSSYRTESCDESMRYGTKDRYTIV